MLKIKDNVSVDDYFKLQSNWNSLKEWLEKERDSEIFDFIAIYNCILDKMNELEGEDKNE